MRPRVFPAEDAKSVTCWFTYSIASMRPRVFPAEDFVPDFEAAEKNNASMRPRVFPAEDVQRQVPLLRRELLQ